MKRPAVYLFALLAFAGVAWGQVTASITGKVEDATGAPVGGATVNVKSLETGALRSATTDQSGEYSVPSLALGQQQVTAEKSGFKEAVRTGVSLTVGQDAVVNLRLEVGDLKQQVTVVEEVPVINTTTASVSGVVGAREVKDLPLNGRSFDNLITLNPGAISYQLKSSGTTTSYGNTFTVDGRRPADNIVLWNGVEYTGSSQLGITPGGASEQLLGIDAIREFNVLTDTYPAEYGKRAGAQVEVVTQSGTNELHGSLFEFLRNNDTDARNFFDGASTSPLRRNQFGGALGGPVKKNRLFQFGNYEGYRYVVAQTVASVVPDAQARQGLLPNATTGVYSKVANLNPAMLNYMSYWPAPNGAELLSGGVASGTAFSYNSPRNTVREDFGTTRTD